MNAPLEIPFAVLFLFGALVGGQLNRGIFRLALLTAQRIGSVSALRWDAVSGEDLWKIPPSDFKGKRAHLVPLSPEARDVLKELREVATGEWVFPGRAGTKSPHLTNTAGSLARIRDRTEIPPWTAHDFRRTFRTHATRPQNPDHPKDPAGLGMLPEVADAVLGHKEATLGFDRYTGDSERYLLSERREALRRWGAFVREAVETDQ